MNTNFIKQCFGEKTSPAPIWIMRQAGRYLPEYQAVRKKTDFLTLCKTPELAAEVTLQPVDILGVDAAILFSDILIPIEPMGMELVFSEGRGPLLSPPIRTEADLKRLRPIEPEEDVPFVLETIKLLRQALKDKVPLIGFAGAPFTLITYMVEGGSSKNFLYTKKMMFEAPELFHSLMSLVTETTIRYLKAQAEAGAQAIQLFDTWAGALSRRDYEEFVFPYSNKILEALKPYNIPRIHFAFNGSHLLPVTKKSACEVIGLDWRMDIPVSVEILGNTKAIQGNMDPCCLFMSKERLKEHVKSLLDQGSNAKGHIFNLGHGVMPEIEADKVKLLVELVHTLS